MINDDIMDMAVYHDGYDDDNTINVMVIILKKWSKMMVTDRESLPRGGMGGVVHTVGTAEDSEQKISLTKLILKCQRFSRSTYRLYFHLKGRQRCRQLPGWTRCRGTPHNNYQPSTKQGNCVCSVSLISVGNKILTKDLHLFFAFITYFEFRQYR